MLVRIRRNGQATIPKAIRLRMRLRTGDHLQLRLEGEVLVARRVDALDARPPTSVATTLGAVLTRSPPQASDADPHSRLLAALRVLRSLLGPLYEEMGCEEPEAEPPLLLPDDVVLRIARVADVAAALPSGLRKMTERIHWAGLDAIPTVLDVASARRWITDHLPFTWTTVEGFFLARGERERAPQSGGLSARDEPET
jgi:AbrB family looped-hinge helix DNA binding protein